MTVTVRPLRLRRISRLVALVIVLASAGIALSLRQASIGVSFGVVDQVAVFGIGLAIARGVLLVGQPTVQADERGVRVHNVVGVRDIPWQAVRAVSFRDSSPWASLDLINDDTIALLAVQAADGERTVDAVRALRVLHGRAQQPS